MRIFATEVLLHRPSARLLIPHDFEAILEERGKRDLYLRQEKYLPVSDDISNLVQFAMEKKLNRWCFNLVELGNDMGLDTS